MERKRWKGMEWKERRVMAMNGKEVNKQWEEWLGKELKGMEWNGKERKGMKWKWMERNEIIGMETKGK